MKSQNKNMVYLAGDSSLDNKYWIRDKFHDALNGYQNILSPPTMIADISYHLNKIFEEEKSNYCAINCAVEESTLDERFTNLLMQDKFIRDNITEEDMIIVSIGGNDIALKPSKTTIQNLLTLVKRNSINTLENNSEAAWGISYFVDMFKKEVENYVIKLTSKRKPKLVIVCMIYYPDESTTGSWAGRTLGYLDYNHDPKKLQTIIHQLFLLATYKINIPGCKVIPFPMYKILDGSCSEDYVQRVEPSDIGGLKLATAFKKVLFFE